ncbi:MAG: pyroglutamyl-peptidase I [Lysobacteraceae bacterium]
MRRAVVLLTGFEPFGGESVNPSQALLTELGGERIAKHRVEPLCLPVNFQRAGGLLCDAIDALQPQIVLCLGQAGGRSRLSFERVAINLIDARIGDDAGDQPVDVPVIDDAPAAYFSDLPLKRMRSTCETVGIPAELSLSAGSYVCNAVFFHLMHQLRHADRAGCRGGFVHLPWLPEQALRYPQAASMCIELMTKGIGLAIETALLHRVDSAEPGGIEH